MHGEPQLGGEVVHRRATFLLAAAGGLGGSGIDGSNVMAGLGQGSQSGHGEGGGAEERNLHRRTL